MLKKAYSCENMLHDEYLAKKSILRAIKPYWLYLIIIGKKTVEVSKSRPSDEGFDGLVFLYCSHDITSFKRIPEEARGWMSKFIGKVACVFECDKVERINLCYVPAYGLGYTPKNCSEINQNIVVFERDDDRIDSMFTPDEIVDTMRLSPRELYEYLLDKNGEGGHGYAWNINKLHVYHGAPLEVSAFHKPCVHIEGGTCRFGVGVSSCEHAKIVYEREGERGENHRLVSANACDRVLKHAPQSWQYVASMRVGESV